MLIIAEGLDRCGKTTLINNLRKNYFKNPNIVTIHSSSPPAVEDKNAWEIDHYDSLFKDFSLLTRIGYDVIFDRFHLGAIVYGEKYRGADGSKIYELDKKYLAGFKKAALILLTDNVEEIMKRDDGESIEKDVTEFESTKRAFEKAFDNSSCLNKLNINITENGGFQNTYGSVTNFLDEVREKDVKIARK
jgi:thymidylate kinase